MEFWLGRVRCLYMWRITQWTSVYMCILILLVNISLNFSLLNFGSLLLTTPSASLLLFLFHHGRARGRWHKWTSNHDWSGFDLCGVSMMIVFWWCKWRLSRPHALHYNWSEFHNEKHHWNIVFCGWLKQGIVRMEAGLWPHGSEDGSAQAPNVTVFGFVASTAGWKGKFGRIGRMGFMVGLYAMVTHRSDMLFSEWRCRYVLYIFRSDSIGMFFTENLYLTLHWCLLLFKRGFGGGRWDETLNNRFRYSWNFIK